MIPIEKRESSDFIILCSVSHTDEQKPKRAYAGVTISSSNTYKISMMIATEPDAMFLTDFLSIEEPYQAQAWPYLYIRVGTGAQRVQELHVCNRWKTLEADHE